MTTNEITVTGNARPLTYTQVQMGDVIAPTLINAWGAMTAPAYYRGLSLLADNLASFPRSVSKDGAKVGADETPHPLTKLLRRAPNGYTGNDFLFWRAAFYGLSHRGNAFIRVERNPLTLAPVALHLACFEDVTIAIFVPEGGTQLEKWFMIRQTAQTPAIVVPQADMIHLQNIGHDAQLGIDPVTLHQSTLQYASTLTRYQTRCLQTGGMLKATIGFPGKMSDDELDTMAAYIQQRFTGPTADRQVMLIPNGGEFKNATLTAQESQIAEQIVAATKSIAQMLNVPPSLLFERDESKYTGVEEEGQYLERYTFRPLVIQIEAELSAKLLSEADRDAGYAVHLNTDALLRGDTETQTTTVTQTVTAGVRTPNEGRAVLGLPAIEDPDANKLKRTGDTAPAATKTDPPEPSK